MSRYGSVLALISTALFAWVLGSEADEIAPHDVLALLTLQLLLLYLLSQIADAAGPGKING